MMVTAVLNGVDTLFKVRYQKRFFFATNNSGFWIVKVRWLLCAKYFDYRFNQSLRLSESVLLTLCLSLILDDGVNLKSQMAQVLIEESPIFQSGSVLR